MEAYFEEKKLDVVSAWNDRIYEIVEWINSYDISFESPKTRN